MNMSLVDKVNHESQECETGKSAYQCLKVVLWQSDIVNIACYGYDNQQDDDQTMEALFLDFDSIQDWS